MVEHFTILGGATAVWSRSADQLLPLEILNGFKVPRSGLGMVVEIGRYAITGESISAVGPRIIQQMATIAMGLGRVDRIVIEADLAHKRLFSKLGFRVLNELKDDYILEVEPEKFLRNSLEAVAEGPSL